MGYIGYCITICTCWTISASAVNQLAHKYIGSDPSWATILRADMVLNQLVEL
jgi:hypothetical protein